MFELGENPNDMIPFRPCPIIGDRSACRPPPEPHHARTKSTALYIRAIASCHVLARSQRRAPVHPPSPSPSRSLRDRSSSAHRRPPSIRSQPAGRPLPRAMMAAAAARSTPLGVPAPRMATPVVVLVLLVLVCAPCGSARPMREGVDTGTAATATARARASPALDDAGHWPRGGAATAAGAHRVTTVGGGAPTPPSGPSQNHN